jgi:hypothetical protein
MSTSLADHLRRDGARLRTLSLVTGFDGFVDELVSVRDEQGRPLASLRDLGAWIAGCAGRNGLRWASRSASAGGCALNLGDAAAALGIQIDFFGTVGQPVHPVFGEFATRCRSFTPWGRGCGRTTAYECADGKAMIAQIDELAAYDAAAMAALLADGRFAAACASASGIALTNWSLYPGMTACWELLGEQVFARLPRRIPVLVDLVDPSTRSPADLAELVALLRRLQQHVDSALALNLGESACLSAHLKLAAPVAGPGLAAAAGRLRAALGVAHVVLHHRDGDAEADATGAVFSVPAPRCLTPVKSTGAGDRFNAGWFSGRLLDWPPAARLALGAATAGAFVRLGRSPSLEEVAAALAQRTAAAGA